MLSSTKLYERKYFQMKTKKIVALLLAIALVLSLGACSGSNNSSNNSTPNSTANNQNSTPADDDTSTGEIVVTIPTYYIGENVGAIYFEPAVKRFNEQNKGKYRIELEEVIEQSYTDIISQQTQAGNIPLVFAVPGKEWLETAVIPSGLYEPMNSFLDANPDIKALCLEGSMEYCTQDNGDIVSVPIITMSNTGSFYNTELYNPEKSISSMSVDEFVDSLGDNKLAFQTGDNAWTSMLFLTSLIANEEGGVEFLQSNEGEKVYDWNEPCFLNAVTKLKEIWDKCAAPTSVGSAYPDAANTFMSNGAAVIFNGPWMNSEFRADSAEKWTGDFDGAKVKADYYPGNIAIGGTKGYGRWMMSNNGTDAEKECAQAFLAFIYSQDELETFALTEGCQIPNMTFSEEFLSKLSEDPLIAAQTELVNSDTKMVPSVSGLMVSSVADTVFANDLVQLVTGAMTPEEFCADLTLKSEESRDE